MTLNSQPTGTVAFQNTKDSFIKVPERKTDDIQRIKNKNGISQQ